MARREIQGKIAIVTGAASGIGRAIAVELARQGASLVLNARREDRLREVAAEIDLWRTENPRVGRICNPSQPEPAERIANPPYPPVGRLSKSSYQGRRIANPPYQAASVVVAAGDVTDPATRQNVVQAAISRFGGVDILVNNAGVGALGRFEDADPGRLRQVMEVNFFAAVELTRLALRLLKQAKSGIVVNVGSVLGHRAIPGSSEYCASKFALRGFSEALRAELAREGIDVLLVSPGTTRTEFFDHLVERRGDPNWRDWGQVTAEYVARKTVQAIRRGDHEVIPSTLGRLLCLVNRLFPRLVDDVLGGHA
jgi:short-subunit dehydrogenase